MEPKLLYHITDYRNLPSILERGGLEAYAQVTEKEISYTDIAHQSIQARRSTTPIPLPPYGMFHDYVPFYFAPRSPMLYSIKQNNVEGFNRTQKRYYLPKLVVAFFFGNNSFLPIANAI
ncbi:DUF4433 domain-containing protein [Aquibacillus sp. 3ASR75-11]|uniref:DUF4433 domain-containing protein n=1 Tax=Terrihalobacillus insolitus TaxID=2950438 RepID=A0A9X3WT94_9BACI|nr:DUF4433 domain-containing protein [Terrihalobacillus insolitus]MDC3424438.1 DUF4433 domain-containing protein [Terrihalobacillus insolitus]